MSLFLHSFSFGDENLEADSPFSFPLPSPGSRFEGAHRECCPLIAAAVKMKDFFSFPFLPLCWQMCVRAHSFLTLLFLHQWLVLSSPSFGTKRLEGDRSFFLFPLSSIRFVGPFFSFSGLCFNRFRSHVPLSGRKKSVFLFLPSHREGVRPLPLLFPPLSRYVFSAMRVARSALSPLQDS